MFFLALYVVIEVFELVCVRCNDIRGLLSIKVWGYSIMDIFPMNPLETSILKYTM